MLNIRREFLSVSLVAAACVASSLAMADRPSPGQSAAGNFAFPVTQPSGEVNYANEADITGAGPLLRADADDNGPAPQSQMPAPIVEFARRQNYQATILHSLDEVQAAFNHERQLAHTSQCHERAEVWSHEISEATHYNLMKVMMFYTQRFRNTFKHSGLLSDNVYKWWYHTAPVVYADIGNGQGPVAYVLDQEFFPDHALTLDEWSYYFLHDEIMPNNRNIPYVDKNLLGRGLTHEETHCQVISNFREFAVPALNNDMNTPWCEMRIYPMYYMQPDDVMQMDCDPNVDADYTLGLTGRGRFHPALGNKVLEKFTTGQLAGHYKVICPHGDPNTVTSFREADLKQACSHTDPDHADECVAR